MISIKTAFLSVGLIFVVIAFLPGLVHVLGHRFGRGFMQGINVELDSQFDHFIKMQKIEKPIKKENKNG